MFLIAYEADTSLNVKRVLVPVQYLLDHFGLYHITKQYIHPLFPLIVWVY